MKFERGFDSVRAVVNRNSFGIRDCNNCKHFYKDAGDKHEMCQNPSVTFYDVIVTETRTYCHQWETIGGYVAPEAKKKKRGNKDSL